MAAESVFVQCVCGWRGVDVYGGNGRGFLRLQNATLSILLAFLFILG